MADVAYETAGIPGKIAYIEKTVGALTNVIVPYVQLNGGTGSSNNTIGAVVPGAVVSSGANQKAVTTAGTSVILATTTPAREVIIKALKANTGKIYVKPGGIAGANYSSNGFELSAGDSVTVQLISNLTDIAIDSSVNGEGVSYIYQGY